MHMVRKWHGYMVSVRSKKSVGFNTFTTGLYMHDCPNRQLVPPDGTVPYHLMGQSCVYHRWFKPVGVC